MIPPFTSPGKDVMQRVEHEISNEVISILKF